MDNDANEDNQLPFKNSDAINHIDITIIPSRPETKELLLMEPEITRSYYPEGVPCHLSYTVFHPPQSF